MLAWKRDQWSPLQLPGLLGWFTVGRNSVVLAGASGTEVTSWSSFPTGSVSLASTGGSDPAWLKNGWGQGFSAIEMTIAGTTVLGTTAAGIVAPGNGTDLPFSLFCSFQAASATDQTIIGWRHSAAASLSALRIASPGGGTLQYRRTDSGSTNVDVAGASIVGVTRRRVGVLHSGTAVTLCLDGAVDGSGASDVGALTCDTFAAGVVGEPFEGLLADVVVINRQASVAEYIAYYNWSITTLGY